MKSTRTIALILSITVSFYMVKSAFWLSYYMMFTTNFIETYCENQDKPDLECDGKCFLSDVLTEKETESPKHASIYLETKLVFSVPNFRLLPAPKWTVSKKHTLDVYKSFYTYTFIDSSFKPPATWF